MSSTGVSFCLGCSFFFRPKHPVVKHESPFPNSSPSSIVCGIVVLSVSGSRVLNIPDIRVTRANVIAGAFGLYISYKLFLVSFIQLYDCQNCSHLNTLVLNIKICILTNQ